MTDQEQIQQLVRQQEQAVQQKDIDGAMTHYDTNVVSFDIVNSLQKTGIDACRERLVSWLAQFPVTFSYAVEDLSVTTSEELAFCYSFNHVQGILTSGESVDMRWRATTCFRKLNGDWLITHEHTSVPFDPASGKALIKLEN